jgi:hypothetical protein
LSNAKPNTLKQKTKSRQALYPHYDPNDQAWFLRLSKNANGGGHNTTLKYANYRLNSNKALSISL